MVGNPGFWDIGFRVLVFGVAVLGVQILGVPVLGIPVSVLDYAVGRAVILFYENIFFRAH